MSAPTIIQEDEHYLYINKPAGYDSASIPGGREASVAAWLKTNYPQYQHFGYSDHDNGLLNRLDFETSGLLVAAKTLEGRGGFLELTRRNGIIKQYLALVDNAFTSSMTIEGSIGSRGRNSKLVRVYLKPRKKDRALPATTVCRPFGIWKEKNVSLVEADIHLGRRHQIRAHLSHKGFSLVGDTLYGSTRTLNDLDIEYPVSFMLHSCAISFHHPIEKRETRIVCPHPLRGDLVISGHLFPKSSS